MLLLLVLLACRSIQISCTWIIVADYLTSTLIHLSSLHHCSYLFFLIIGKSQTSDYEIDYHHLRKKCSLVLLESDSLLIILCPIHCVGKRPNHFELNENLGYNMIYLHIRSCRLKGLSMLHLIKSRIHSKIGYEAIQEKI